MAAQEHTTRFLHSVLTFLLLFLLNFYTAVAPAAPATGLPPSLERVGKVEAFPNEYPGQVYAFNWCLNGDGVTPVNKSAFRISKPLDLKVAGLEVPRKMPLAVSLLIYILLAADEEDEDDDVVS